MVDTFKLALIQKSKKTVVGFYPSILLDKLTCKK